MRRFSISATLSLAALFFSFAATHAGEKDGKNPQLTKKDVFASLVNHFYGISSSHPDALFVGSELCMGCHSGPNAIFSFDTSPWRHTLHARPIKEVRTDRYSMVPGRGIISDSNGNGIDDFKDGLDFNAEDQSAFEAYKPNAPVLGYNTTRGYTMTIAGETYSVFFAIGGNQMPSRQQFVVRIPVTDRPAGFSAGSYLSPLQYNEKTSKWVAYHPESWWKPDGSPVFGPGTDSAAAAARGRSFDRQCSGCHFTGTIVRQDSFGEWVSEAAPAIIVDPTDPTYIDMNGDGMKEMTHIGCESCHGPGSLHVQLYGSPDAIVNPARQFSALQANEACGACHLRGTSTRGTFGFAWDEETNHPYINGESLGEYLLPDPALWPDGKTSRENYQQFHDFYESSKPTYPSHMVRCTECHGPHIDTDKLIVREIDGIPTEIENNTLCLACHATHGPFEEIQKEMVAAYEQNRLEIAQVVSAHTNHPYGPERTMGLSRCTTCHMPKVAASAVDYDISSHTFEAIPPGKTLRFQEEGGMPSSCAVSCHRNIVDIFPNSVDDSISNWTEVSDRKLAEWLTGYYGPDGKWWKTKDEPEE